MNAQPSRTRWSLVGAITASVAASICCLGPMLLLALGVGGAWATSLTKLEPYRPIFIALAIGLLALAFKRAYRASEGESCATDGLCAVPRSTRINRMTLWIIAPLIVALLAIPYVAPHIFANRAANGASPFYATFGNTQDACCPPSTQSVAASEKDSNMRKNANPNLVSLFDVPLVCSAAPQIGCGLRAKPILLALQNDPSIAGAWLNRAGTVLAVVGTGGSGRESRAKAVQVAAMAKDGSTATELQGEPREQQLKSFLSADAWYRGAEVDALSKQEAGIIAARLVRRVQSRITLSDAKAKALQSAIAEASYRFVSGQVDVPQRDFMQKYGKELMDLAARAKLDQAEIAALKEAVAKGYRPDPDETEPTTMPSTLMSKTPAIGDSCKLSPAELAARRQQLIPALFKRADKVEDIPNGLRFHFQSKPGLLTDLARIMEQEQDCCSFLRIQLTMEASEGPITFDVTGPQGTGDMLRKL